LILDHIFSSSSGVAKQHEGLSLFLYTTMWHQGLYLFNT
jgi:hypothetical protein